MDRKPRVKRIGRKEKQSYVLVESSVIQGHLPAIGSQVPHQELQLCEVWARGVTDLIQEPVRTAHWEQRRE